MKTYTPPSPADRNKALIISVFFYTLVLIISFFIIWSPPNPPLDAGSGLELNFGTDDAGSGDVQTYNPGGTPAPVQPPAPGEVKPATQVPENQPTENAVKPQPTETQTPDMLTTRDEESEVEVPTKEKAKPQEVRPEPAKPKAEPKPVINEKALFTKKNTGAGGKTDGSGNRPAGGNEGDDTGKTGHKGQSDGDLDGRAYFGKKGSGGQGNGGQGGASMNVPGWRWTARPKPIDESSEEGKIVFTVRIDEAGKVLSCVVRETTVSPTLVAIYKKEIMENTRFETDNNGTPAPVSTGTITFLIRGK
jgi:periplasmic protein TonB